MIRRIITLVIILSAVFFSFDSYAKRIALVIDASKSLYWLLPEEKKSIIAIVELLSSISPKDEIKILKFGGNGEGSVIYDGELGKIDVEKFQNHLDRELNRVKLYNRTSFLEGFKLALDNGDHFDTTIFITDGKDEFPEGPIIFNNKLSSKNLGQVIFILIPDKRNEFHFSSVNAWGKVLPNVQIEKANTNILLKDLIFTLMRNKIEGNLAGFGEVQLFKYLTLEKYSPNSKMLVIVFPSLKIGKPPSDKISVFHGKFITYLEIPEGLKGKFLIPLKNEGNRFLFFYESVKIRPEIKVIPNKESFSVGESINFKACFSAAGKEIKNRLFSNSLNVGWYIDKSLKQKGLLEKKGIFYYSFKRSGKYRLFFTYSYFPGEISKLTNCSKALSLTIVPPRRTISVEIDKNSLWEYRKFKVRITHPPHKESITLLLNGTKPVSFSERNNFTATLCLPPGEYYLTSTIKKFVLAGDTYFKVKPRKIICKVFKGNGKEQKTITIVTSDKILEIPFPLSYYSGNNSKDSFRLEFFVYPLFKGEISNINFLPLSSNKLSLETYGKVYLPFLLAGFPKEIHVPVTINTKKNYIYVNFFRKKNSSIEEFKDNDIPLGTLVISLHTDRKILFPEKKIYAYLLTEGRGEFLVEQWSKRILIVSLLLLIIFISFVVFVYIMRLRARKIKLWREILSLSPADFYDDIPIKVRKSLDKHGGKEVLENYVTLDPKSKEEIEKMGVLWHQKDLLKFLNKLTSPVSKYSDRLTFADFPVTIGAFNPGSRIIRLRDKDLEGRSLQLYVEGNNLYAKLNGRGTFKLGMKEYPAGYAVSLGNISSGIRRKLLFGNYDIEISGNERNILLNIIRRL